MGGLFQLGHSLERIVKRNILGPGKSLLHLDEFVLAHNKHVAEIADLGRSVGFSKRRGNADIIQGFPSFFKMLNKLPYQFIGQDFASIFFFESQATQLAKYFH